MEFAIFDLDGTLIDNMSKTSFNEGDSFDWAKFMESSMECCTFESTFNLMKEYQERGILCMICTARPEYFEMLVAQDLLNRKLGEDILVMRDDNLWREELKEMEGITDPIAIKAIAHKHHAKFRELVIEDLETQYGTGCIKYAVDDQSANLDTFLKVGVECKLVVDGQVVDYVGEM